MAAESEILDIRYTRKKYTGKLVAPSWALEQGEGRTRTAGNSLLFIAAFQTLPSFFHYLSGSASLDLFISQLIIGSIFIGCFFLSRKHPIAAFSIVLFIYWGILGLGYFILGVAISTGILWKMVFSGIILAGLANSIYCSFKRDELRKLELKYPEDVHLVE